MTEYPIVLTPLSEEDGGGFTAWFPDLPGCMSDGDTHQEALSNALDAFGAWIEVQEERGVEIPEPFSANREAADQYKSMTEVVKAAFEYAEAADGHIEYLERALQSAVERNETSWWTSTKLVLAKPSRRMIPVVDL